MIRLFLCFMPEVRSEEEVQLWLVSLDLNNAKKLIFTLKIPLFNVLLQLRNRQKLSPIFIIYHQLKINYSIII